MRRKTLWDIQSGSKDPDELTRQEALRFLAEAIMIAGGTLVGFAILVAVAVICRGGF